MTFSVSEGQAYDPNFFATSIVDEQVEAQAAGFVGKPQLIVDQTILTGEIQHLYAISYTVEKGDSLLSVAQRYNTTVAQLIETNHIAVDEIEKIKPGTEILIPSSEKPDSTSLAWLNELNTIKEKEKEAARQAEIERQRRLQRNQRLTLPNNSRSGVRIASSYGSYSVIGRFTNLGNNGGKPGQCTWWVLSKAGLSGQWGNANQYLSSARAKGFATGKTPRAGSIAVFAEGYVGHVGWVEAVNGNTFTISEMNFVGPFVANYRTLSADYGALRGFVYVR